MSKIKVGFIIDPLDELKPEKDTSIALMREVAKLDGSIFTACLSELLVKNDRVYANMHEIHLHSGKQWYSIVRTHQIDLNSLDHIWLRKDPPFDQKYLYATLILDLVVSKGGRVFNDPKAIRSFNEKLFTLKFKCVPDLIVSSNKSIILEFLAEHGTIVIKALDSYGGKGVILIEEKDINKETIINIMTNSNSIPIMAQKYIPEIKKGDKRILIFNNQAYPKALLRIPKSGDLRGNIDAGAVGKLSDLTEEDLKICNEILPILKDTGIVFAGIDVIGKYCTEINITSPTCVKEIENLTGENISSRIINSVLR